MSLPHQGRRALPTVATASNFMRVSRNRARAGGLDKTVHWRSDRMDTKGPSDNEKGNRRNKALTTTVVVLALIIVLLVYRPIGLYESPATTTMTNVAIVQNHTVTRLVNGSPTFVPGSTTTQVIT